MATLKGIGFNQTNARTTTGSTGDTVSFDVQVVPNAGGTGLSVTNDAFVGGNLVVTGDITSRSTSQLLVGDQFIDLAVGNNTDVHLPLGYTGQVASANGFTEETSASFTTAGAENGASGSVVLTGVFTGTNKGFTITCLTINNNAQLDLVFDDTSTATPTAFSGSFGATGTVTIGVQGLSVEQTVNKIVTFLTGNTRLAVDGVNSITPSKTGTNTVTFTSTLGRWVQTNITFGDLNTSPTTRNNGTATNNMAKITFGGATSFRQGDILALSQADTTSNDGLFGVIHNAGNDAFICTTGAFYPTYLGFLQSDLTTDATDNGAKAVCVDLYVQAVSDGVIPKTGGGTTVLGELVDQFAQDCTFSDFATYQTVGAGITSLQIAYDNGNSITTSGNDIDLVLTNGALDINHTASGFVDMNGDGKVSIVSSNVSSDAIVLNASGGGLDLNGNAVTIDSTTSIGITSTTTLNVDAGTNLTTSVGGTTGIAKYALCSIQNNTGGTLNEARIVRLSPQTGSTATVQVNAVGVGTIADGDTLTLQRTDGGSDVVITAKASGAGAGQFNIVAGQSDSTASALANAITLNANFTAVAVGSVVTITQAIGGTDGNGKTCVSSDLTAMFKPSNSGSQPDNFATGTNRDIALCTNANEEGATILGILASDVADTNNAIIYGSESMIKSANFNFATAELGQKCYLATNGQVTSTPTSVSTEFVVEAGIMFDSDTLLFRPQFIMENG